MKKGERIVCIDKSFQHFTFDAVYEVESFTSEEFFVTNNIGQVCVFDRSDIPNVFFKYLSESKNNIELGDESELEAPKYYDNSNGSLYKLAYERKWNPYVYEVVKRLDRAERKGEFISDIKKSIHVLELYLKEQQCNFEGEIERLNIK